MSRPCVLHIQAMSHARSVTPSTKVAYATGSSFANDGSFLSRCKGRGRGVGPWSAVLEADGLLLEEWAGVSPGNGASREP